MKIQTIIASSVLISNLAFGQTPPTPDGKPTFNNIPNFLSGSWNLNGDVYPFSINTFDFVTKSGPSISAYSFLPAKSRSYAWVNPPEDTQNGTNVWHNLSFYYQYSNIGFSRAKVKLNGLFFCYVPPASDWTKFSTNINTKVVNQIGFELENTDNFARSIVYKIDAVQWNPIYSFPENNQTNFVVSADGTNVKWNSLIYPGGAAGFKLWGQSNATLPFFRITNNPTLTNGWFSVNLTTQSNFFYQLKTQ